MSDDGFRSPHHLFFSFPPPRSLRGGLLDHDLSVRRIILGTIEDAL